MAILSLEEMKRKVHINTGFFETNNYTEETQMPVVSGNFDGAGISVGNLQYNFGPADRALELFTFMINNYPSIVQSAFGTYTAEHDEFVNMITTQTRTERIAWGESKTDYVNDPDGRLLFTPWEECLDNILITPECITKYNEMSDTYYFPLAYDLFRQLDIFSRASLASLYDLNVNRGRFYPINTLVVDFENIEADATITDKEAEKIRIINVRGNDATNAMDEEDASWFIQRRECQGNQGGTYYGSLYDPEVQFDITQEVAIAEKADTLGVNLGEIQVQNLYLGTTPIESIYLGASLLGGKPEPYTTTKVPQTQFRTNEGSYQGIGAVTSVDLAEGQPIWIDVQNWVACKTYYTIDGSTPTTDSAVYHEELAFTASCTLKTLTVSSSGVAEPVKTLTVNVADAPTTTISPSEIVQNNIPITVTLTTDESGATIKYKIGANATEYTYSAPFEVSQTNVNGTQIKITYWAIGVNGTEAQKSLTYDTSGAIPEIAVVSVVNGANQVALDWQECANATSYTIYRSTVSGELGTILSGTQYMTATNWTDTTATGGTTYYYTVRSANYGTSRDSAQVTGEPTTEEPTTGGWRYFRITPDSMNGHWQGCEIEILEGATNRSLASTGALVPSADGANTFGTYGGLKDGNRTTATVYYTWGYPLRVDVDLGAIYPVDAMDIYLGSSTTNKTTGATVEVSTDNVTWVTGKVTYVNNPTTLQQHYTITT